MKKLTLILTILICNVILSQEKSPVVIQPNVITEEKLENNVYEKVDKDAIFLNGGITGFRKEFASLFDSSKVKGKKGLYKTSILFIVERDGTMTNFRATGENISLNEEAIKTFKKIKNRWTPASIDNQPVRSYFRMPISFIIE